MMILIFAVIAGGIAVLYSMNTDAQTQPQPDNSNSDNTVTPTQSVPDIPSPESSPANDPIFDLSHAIAFAEGGISLNGNVNKNSVPGRANNPGDIVAGDVGHGVIVSSGGEKITVFATANETADPSYSDDDGWARIYHQVSIIGKGSHFTFALTFQTFANYYVNGNPGLTNAASSAWAKNVISYLRNNGYSVSVSDSLGSVLNG